MTQSEYQRAKRKLIARLTDDMQYNKQRCFPTGYAYQGFGSDGCWIEVETDIFDDCRIYINHMRDDPRCPPDKDGIAAFTLTCSPRIREDILNGIPTWDEA